MRLERMIWIVALVAVGAIGFFSGQIVGVRAGEQERQLAVQQFLGQRGGGPGAGGSGQNGSLGRGQNTFAGGGIAGTVASISGNTLTITTRNGQTARVELAPNGTVRKQVDGQLSDIKPGDQVVAIGTQNGDTFSARSIQLGGLGPGERPVVAPAGP
jgi:preprotein translocase subunit YajC